MNNEALVQKIVRDVAELPDRTSPEDWPEAMLVTGDELAGIIRKALAQAQPVAVPDGEPRFFIEHGVIHDSKIGRHVISSVSMEEDFGEKIQATVDTLNELDASAKPSVIAEDPFVWRGYTREDVANQAKKNLAPMREQTHALLSAIPAQPAEAGADESEEAYEMGKRDGYEAAVQDIDIVTGGDGEYRYCTDGDPDRHTPDAAAMKQRIVERFNALQGQLADLRGYFRDMEASYQDALKRLRAAETRLAETRGQEAVAWIYTHNDGSNPKRKGVTMQKQQAEEFNDIYAGPIVPLYAAPPAADERVSDAARDVLAERQRKIEHEGWTAEKDDKYRTGSLSLAAALAGKGGGS